MTAINDRTHAERITREAAKAIGLHVPDTAYWDVRIGGLVFSKLSVLNGTQYDDNCFAPLNDPADAYKIEVALKINVFHRALSNESYVMSLRDSEDASGPALMKTVNKGDDALRLRMEVVTMFAALTLIMAEA